MNKSTQTIRFTEPDLPICPQPLSVEIYTNQDLYRDLINMDIVSRKIGCHLLNMVDRAVQRKLYEYMSIAA